MNNNFIGRSNLWTLSIWKVFIYVPRNQTTNLWRTILRSIFYLIFLTLICSLKSCWSHFHILFYVSRLKCAIPCFSHCYTSNVIQFNCSLKSPYTSRNFRVSSTRDWCTAASETLHGPHSQSVSRKCSTVRLLYRNWSATHWLLAYWPKIHLFMPLMPHNMVLG